MPGRRVRHPHPAVEAVGRGAGPGDRAGGCSARHTTCSAAPTCGTAWSVPSDLTRLRDSVLGELTGLRSDAKRVPESIWAGGADRKRLFLQALFTGDGSCSALPRNTIQISYSTCSDQLAGDVQQLLLEFGVVSRSYRHASGEFKVVITNRRDARVFSAQVGFLGVKQAKLEAVLGAAAVRSTALSSDYVPGLAPFLRQHGATDARLLHWLGQHNLDRIERWEQRGDEILAHITDPDARAIAQELTDGRFYFASVAAVDDAGVQPVYSIRVDTDDHSFITDGFVSHNTECRLSPLAMAMLAGHRRGHRRLHRQLRRQDPGAGRPAVPGAEPADQRQRRDRGRHGHQRAAAQPARGRRRRGVGAGPLGGDRRGAARRPDGADQGPGLPDRRPDRRPGRHRAGLPHRPWLGADARRGRGRGGRAGPHHPGRHRAALPGQPGQPDRVDRQPSTGTASWPASPRSTTSRRTGSACAS